MRKDSNAGPGTGVLQCGPFVASQCCVLCSRLLFPVLRNIKGARGGEKGIYRAECSATSPPHSNQMPLPCDLADVLFKEQFAAQV